MTERPEIIGIEGDVAGDDARITVTLNYNDNRFYGQALGDAAPHHRARLAGEATLRAIESLTGSRVRLELLAVAAADLGRARVALAQVRLDDGDILVGSALMPEGEPDQAALQAGLTLLQQIDFRDCLSSIDKPVMLIGGERDTLVPQATLPEIARLFTQQAQLHIIEGAGHAPFLSHPAETAKLIKAFCHA